MAEVLTIAKQRWKNSLIVGWNTEAINLYDRLLAIPALQYNTRAFISPAGENISKHHKNVPVAGDLNDLAEAIVNYEIDEVLIILSTSEKKYLSEIISICTANHVDYKVVSDTYDSEYKHVIHGVIRDVIRSERFGSRRVFDIFVSLTLLILLLPLFIAVAIAIRLESKGPVFYTQQRYGLDGRIFPVYKFRSMVQDAEKLSGPVWAKTRDPRITRVGMVMRKTRIDELPQLMNVLSGDMSMIGPRPERPFFADMFKKQIPLYMNRLKVRPGITGLAQVTVGYDETIEDVKDKLAKDIEYIENRKSWKMNFRILLSTVKVVFFGEGQ